MADYSEDGFIQKLSGLAQNNDIVEVELYNKLDVCRGLRYKDGRGVLVGLSKIGDVVGKAFSDGLKL